MTSSQTDRLYGIESSVALKAPVMVATTSNITLSSTQVIDGVAVSSSARVLVKDQTDAAENGIYAVRTGDWLRAGDFDGARDFVQGTQVYVNSGTVNADTVWRVSSTGVAVDTDNINWELGQVYTPGVGGFRWNFDSSTSMADPGSGDIRLNNATLASVTAIAISATTGDIGSPDAHDFVAAWDDSTTATNKGTVVIKKLGAPENFAIYAISGNSTDNTTWLQLAVTHVASSGSFTAADGLAVQWTRAGNQGSVSGPSATVVGDVPLWDSTDATVQSSGIAIGTSGTVLVKADTNNNWDGNQTFRGSVTHSTFTEFGGKEVRNPLLVEPQGKPVTVASSSGVLAIASSDGTYFFTTLTENVTTFTVTPPSTDTLFTLAFELTQASTAKTFAWGDNVLFGSVGAPTITTVNGVTVVTLFGRAGSTAVKAVTTWQSS